MRAKAPVCRLTALLLATTCSVFAGAVALPSFGSAQDQGVRSYQIPAGDLTAALNRFADASQIQLVYDASVTRGLNSPGLSGSYTPSQALAQLLAGSGLDWRFANARTVTISGPAPAGEQVGLEWEAGTILLDEIQIVGEKLPRDRANVYTSVGVVTNTEITEFAISDADEALNKTANVRVNRANGNNSGIVVRGVSSEGFSPGINQTNAVAVIIDGAAQNQEGIRRGSRGTWDVESIEVLRGPQSTLQGNNAMAGAVVVNTYVPTFEWTGSLMGDFSMATEYDDGYANNGAFMLSGPLIENQLAFRLSGQIIEGEKGIEYAEPVFDPLDDDEFEQFRGKVLFTPEALDGFRAEFTASHTRDKLGVATVTGPDFFDRRFDPGRYNSELRETTVDSYIADLSQDFGNGLVLRSVTSYIETDAELGALPDQPYYFRDDLRDGTDFHQDLRLELAPDRRLSGVAGLYYGNIQNDIDSIISEYGTLYQDFDAHNTTESWALYGDFRYEFVDQWALLFGGRVGQDVVGNEFLGTFFLGPIDLDVSETFNVALPKIGLAYDLTPDQSFAFTLSEGYRPGFTAVTPDYFNGGQAVYEVEPESMWAYELAYRSKWMDSRLEFNANAFYYDIRDLQVEIAPFESPYDAIPATINLDRAHAYGAEFEVLYRPYDSLTTFASLGLLKTHIDEGLVTQFPEEDEIDFSGNQLPESPLVTLNLGAVYRHSSGFFLAGDVTFTDDYFSAFDLDNDPDQKVPAYTVVNASVGYEVEHGSLTLYVKNLFDEQYVTGIGGSGQANVGDGRIIGFQGIAKF